MDPVTTVVTALVAGAAAGTSDVVSTAVKDAYGKVKSSVGARLRRAGLDDDAGQLLIGDAAQDGPGREVLVRELTRVEVDDETVAAARHLLQLLEAGSQPKYAVRISDAKGVAVGDHTRQTNTFHGS